jgi:hypothetical protein
MTVPPEPFFRHSGGIGHLESLAGNGKNRAPVARMSRRFPFFLSHHAGVVENSETCDFLRATEARFSAFRSRDLTRPTPRGDLEAGVGTRYQMAGH